MNYPHRVLIRRPSGTGGGTVDDDGNWVPDPDNPPLTIYEGWADVQDMGTFTNQAGNLTEMIGAPTYLTKVVMYPEDERMAAYVETGDIVDITWEDQTVDQAQVVEGRRLDGAIPLRWLQGPTPVPPGA